MADIAHKLTDAELTALERRIKTAYKRAGASIQKRADKFFADFKDEADKLHDAIGAAKDAEARLAATKAYKDFMMRKTTAGKNITDLRDKIASDLLRFNQQTAAEIGDRMNGVFALNHNFAAYTLEKDLGLNLQFTLYDKRTVERLLKEEPRLLPKPKIDVPADMRWNQQKIAGEIAQGVLTGEPLTKIAERLQNVVGMNESSAIRNARTAMTGAQNAGRIESYHYAESIGIKLKKEWLATLDDRTRDSHRDLDGQRVDVDEPFSVDGEDIMYPGDPDAAGHLVYGCFVGETKIASDSEVIRSYKYDYDGDLVSVKTTLGVNFSCTPNHPILTTRGWIRARFLDDSYNLVVASIGNGSNRGGNCDIEDVHSSFKASHGSSNQDGSVHRVSADCVNFHGDIPTSDVEVVTKKRLLRKGFNTSSFKRGYKIVFEYPYKPFSSNRPFMKSLIGVRNATLSIVRLLSDCTSFIFGRLRHSDIHGFRPIAWSYSGALEDAINDLSAKSKLCGELLCGRSRNVLADKIVSVEIVSAKRHVFNLQTENGYYFVNSSIPQKAEMCNGIYAIAHNCRCTLVSSVSGVEKLDPEYRRDNINGELIEKMSYREWEAARNG